MMDNILILNFQEAKQPEYKEKKVSPVDMSNLVTKTIIRNTCWNYTTSRRNTMPLSKAK